MKFRFLSFFQEGNFSRRLIRYPWFVALLINIIIWILILIKIRTDYRPIPLHFNAFYGIEFVGAGYLFFELPFIGAIIMILNLFLSRLAFPRDEFLAVLLAFGTAIIQLLFLLAVLNIMALID